MFPVTMSKSWRSMPIGFHPLYFFLFCLWLVWATGAAVAAFAAHRTQLQSVKWFVYMQSLDVCVCGRRSDGQTTGNEMHFGTTIKTHVEMCLCVWARRFMNRTSAFFVFCCCWRCCLANVLTACHFVQSPFLRCYVDQLWPLLTECHVVRMAGNDGAFVRWRWMLQAARVFLLPDSRMTKWLTPPLSLHQTSD